MAWNNINISSDHCIGIRNISLSNFFKYHRWVLCYVFSFYCQNQLSTFQHWMSALCLFPMSALCLFPMSALCLLYFSDVINSLFNTLQTNPLCINQCCVMGFGDVSLASQTQAWFLAFSWGYIMILKLTIKDFLSALLISLSNTDALISYLVIWYNLQDCC